MQYDRKKTAHCLKVLRAKAQMSQEELADASGVSVSAIASYEREAAVPKADIACALAEALGCTPNDICGWEQ